MRGLRLTAFALIAAAWAAGPAAASVWTGGAVGDWSVASNWSPAGVPGPADAVSIPSGTVVAYSSNAALSVAALTLGFPAAAPTAILRISTGLAVSGALILQNGAALQVASTEAVSAQDLSLAVGSSVTLSVPAVVTVPGPALRLYVSGSLTAAGGSTITARGRGYAGGIGAAAGAGAGGGGAGSAASGGGGGGHGGAGGAGGAAANAGAIFDSMPPSDGGGGGGGAPSADGGAGGGSIYIYASTATIDGLVDADGQDGATVGTEGGGGGGGGAVLIDVGVLRGTGTVSARGGAGGGAVNFGGGGGGGGRLWIREQAYASLGSTLTLRSGGGALGVGGTASGIGGASGAPLMNPLHWTGAGADALASNGANWSGGAPPAAGARLILGSSATAKACIWDLGVAVASVTILPQFSTSVVLSSSLTVTGSFDMAGGTLAAAGGLVLRVDGALQQTGGRMNVSASTIALAAAGGAVAVRFFDASALRLVVGGAGAATATVSGFVTVSSRIHVSSGAQLVLSTGILRLSGDGPFTGTGGVSASTGHWTEASGSSTQTWIRFSGSLGRLRVSNTSAGGLVLSTAAGSSFTLTGGLTVDPAAVVRATAVALGVGGDWSAAGRVYLARSTVTFSSSLGNTASILSGGSFDFLVADMQAGTLLFSTSVTVASTVTVLSGNLDLSAASVTVRGFWTETGGVVIGGSSRVLFDGAAAQAVVQRPGSSFGAFVSSSAVSMTIAGPLSTTRAFEWHRGALSFAGRALTIRGDMLNKSGGTPATAGSTTTLVAASTQNVTFATLDSVVIDNANAAGVRLGVNASWGNFTINPGRTFDGGARSLTIAGDSWSTAGANYLSVAQQHAVTWSPTTAISVGAGSVVNAKLALSSGKTAVLQGGLFIDGAGNAFDPKLGSTVINAPGGSTITFRGSADLIPSSGSNWFYGGDIADSWLVFQGTGSARGSGISTNTFGNVVVSLNSAADIFRAPDLNLLGSLYVTGGTLRPQGSRTIALAGDLLQTGGVIDFATPATGTVRFNGASSQTLSLLPGSALWNLIAAGTGTVSAASSLSVRGDFALLAGQFLAGASTHSIQGNIFVSSSATFSGQASTITLDGGAGGLSYQTVSFAGGGAFHGLNIVVSSAAFLTSATAQILTDAVAGSTLAVAGGATLRVADFRIGASSGAATRLCSVSPGVAWFLQVVVVSSVTQALVQDSDASGGLTVGADDGRSFDAGGNVNWDFLPQLLVLLPGESFTPGAPPGKSGAPSIATAGVPVTVSLRAISSSFQPVTAAVATVTIDSDDQNATLEAAHPLAAGATSFTFTPRTAEPSPRSTLITALAPFASASASLSVVPSALTRLQVVVSGESAAPGTASGKIGTASARVRGIPFSATVRAVDSFWNLISTATDAAALSISAASATLPASAALSGGQKVFSGIVAYSTGLFTLSATDLTQPGVEAGTSAVFGVSPPSASTPVLGGFVPNGARVATLSGGVSGFARDDSAVERVLVDLRDLDVGLHFNWNTQTFSLAGPSLSTAALASPLTPGTTWFRAAADAAFTDGHRVRLTVSADNPSGLLAQETSTFTFDRGMLAFGARDGQGAAAVLPASAPGCTEIISTLTVTVGASGIGPGGALAVRAPDGWSLPLGVTAQYPPPFGYWHAASTSQAVALGSTAALVSPSVSGGVVLGPGWLLLSVATHSARSYLPGERIVLSYRGRPPLAPGAIGARAFSVMTRGDSAGVLLPISTAPAITLLPGASNFLAFADPSPLSLTPLTASPTMQLVVTDLCGNLKPGLSSGTVGLSVSVLTGGGAVVDAGAQFFNAQSTPISSVFLSTGLSAAASPSFSVLIATDAPAELVLRASATFSGSAFAAMSVEAVRSIRLRAAAPVFNAVSIGTGAPSAGTTSAVLSAEEPGVGAVQIRFSLPDPELTWEALVSADGGAFSSPVFSASGYGDASRGIALGWDGMDRSRLPPSYAPAGHYPVRLRAGGGAVEDRTLEVVVPPTAGYAGRLGARGAGALISAAGAARWAVASSTGYFELRGLKAGRSYALSVTTESVVLGRALILSTSVAASAAAVPLNDLGALSFPATGYLRVALQAPVPSPRDALGGFVARAPDGAAVFSGTLRLASGAASSDDAGPLFGRAASTWSVVIAPAGVYDLDVEISDLRLSTRVTGVNVPAAGGADLLVPLGKKANVFGFVILPTTVPFGTWITVQARKADEAAPSVFGGVFVSSAAPVSGPSSGAYALYGLDPGSWTVLARAPGFTASTAALFISGGDDLGRPGVPGGADLALRQGGTISGSISVSGDTRSAAQCFPSSGGAPADCPAGAFELEVEALAVGRLDRAASRVRLGTHASFSSATFAVSGLEAGSYVLRSFLPGYGLLPPQGATATIVASGSSSANLSLSSLDAGLRVEIAVPPLASGACRPASSYRSLGLSLESDGRAPLVFGDVTAMSSVLLHCSSVTAFTSALPPGGARASALFSATGGFARGRTTLADGTTTTLFLDLSGSTFAVGGTLSFSGLLGFSTRTSADVPLTVAVSSVAGVLSQAPRVSFCLLGSGDPVGASALRAELLPYDDAPAPLRRAQSAAAGSCAAVAASTAAAASAAYVAAIGADGRFSFGGVSPGLYWLRAPGELDDDASGGPEVAEARTLVRVEASAVSASLRLARGHRVSGRVAAAAGFVGGRPLRVALYAADGSLARYADVSCGASGGNYSIDGVSDGRYRLSVSDLGEPAAWTARPVEVVVAGADLDGRDAELAPASSIRARLSLVRTASDGSEETVLVSRENAFLLPPGFTARATAVPYEAGGVVDAHPASDGSVVDSEGRVVIAGLPPGTYDVEFAASGAAPGSVLFAPARVSGVKVGAGQASDLGVVPLFSAAAVSGQVRSAATGLPAAGVRVTARPTLRAGALPGSSAPTAVTDAAGRYVLRGLSPALRWYDVVAAPRAASFSGEPAVPYESKRVASVDVSSGAVLDFVLAAATAAVTGRVVAADGSLLSCALGPGAAEGPGAALFLQKFGAPPSEDPLADLAVRSEPDGRFLIPSLATGSYRLTVTAAGQASLVRSVILSTAVADLGVLVLGGGGSVSGSLRLPDGSAVPDEEAYAVAAVTADLSEFIYGSLTRDASVGTSGAYKIGGLRAGRAYRILLLSQAQEASAPAEAAAVVLASSAEARALDLIVRPPAARVSARARRTGTRFTVDFLFSRPLRARLPGDDDAGVLVATVAATGALSGWRMSDDRRRVSVDYEPGVGESSFTLRARAPTAGRDYDSADPSARELVAAATAAFFTGETGANRAVVANAVGGTLVIEGDASRVSLPRGAFLVDASSAVEVTLRRAPTAVAAGGLPSALRAAAAALPAGLPARSDFYEIELPAGVPSTLARPAQLTLVYSSAVADPSALNLYWYNPGSGQFVLQPDAFGGAAALDAAARSLTLNVNHLSTFVLLDSGAAAIGGSAYSGELDAYNFPNPFDLQVKTVTSIHGAGAQSVRGTMIRVAVPASLSGEGKLRIFDAAGGLIRTIDLGTLAGGQSYYQGWDGRNDGGADAASGLYIGQVQVGSKRKSFKMAVLK